VIKAAEAGARGWWVAELSVSSESTSWPVQGHRWTFLLLVSSPSQLISQLRRLTAAQIRATHADVQTHQ